MSIKPTLNNARLMTFKNYAALYDIQVVDAEQKIMKGRPYPAPVPQGVPLQQLVEADWVFFLSEYDKENDWDRLYHELNLPEELCGTPIKLVPMEKLLFRYTEPSEILLPNPTIKFGGR